MNAGLLILGIALIGLVLGLSTILSMPTPAGYRVLGVVAVILITFFVLGLVFTGAVTSAGVALLAPLLAPPIMALALRAYFQSRHERSQKAKRA